MEHNYTIPSRDGGDFYNTPDKFDLSILKSLLEAINLLRILKHRQHTPERTFNGKISKLYTWITEPGYYQFRNHFQRVFSLTYHQAINSALCGH